MKFRRILRYCKTGFTALEKEKSNYKECKDFVISTINTRIIFSSYAVYVIFCIPSEIC
jgi:hypothetical protein